MSLFGFCLSILRRAETKRYSIIVIVYIHSISVFIDLNECIRFNSEKNSTWVTKWIYRVWTMPAYHLGHFINKILLVLIVLAACSSAERFDYYGCCFIFQLKTFRANAHVVLLIQRVHYFKLMWGNEIFWLSNIN